MPEIYLDPLNGTDISFIHELLNDPAVMTALHMHPTNIKIWEEAYTSIWNDPDEENYIIKSGGNSIGWIKLNGLTGKTDAWLSMLAVCREYQHRGYGSRAVALAEAMLRKRDYTKLRVHTTGDNNPAVKCYLKCGYIQYECYTDTNADGSYNITYTFVKNLSPDIKSIKNHWGAYAYEQLEDEADDIKCLLMLIGDKPKNILEVCCGSGRILVPLAHAGHTVTGFDIDENMLAYIPLKTFNTDNIRYFRVDALKHDWGNDYDIVVLAGNIMINIQTDGSYEEAQVNFINKAVNALRPGGLLYLDFNLFAQPEKFFSSDSERVIFEITDDTGVYGKYSILYGKYDTESRISVSKCKTLLRLPNGDENIFLSDSIKHILSLDDIHSWLRIVGLQITAEYGSYDLRPISEDTYRAVILAEKRQ